MSVEYIMPNLTTIPLINGYSAYSYVSLHDDEGNISGENIFTNILNIFGSLPVICIISGLVRKIFAEKELENLPRTFANRVAIKHYENHLHRALGEIIIPMNFIVAIILDLRNTFKESSRGPRPPGYY